MGLKDLMPHETATSVYSRGRRPHSSSHAHQNKQCRQRPWKSSIWDEFEPAQTFVCQLLGWPLPFTFDKVHWTMCMCAKVHFPQGKSGVHFIPEIMLKNGKKKKKESPAFKLTHAQQKNPQVSSCGACQHDRRSSRPPCYYNPGGARRGAEIEREKVWGRALFGFRLTDEK